MSKQQQPILSLAMSQIISPDAPLLSPTDSQWDGQQPLFSPHDNFTYSYYNLPPSPPNSEGSHLTDSPVPAARMLKMRTTPDNDHEICLPTHQVFDFADIPRPPTPPSRSPSLGVEAGRAFSHFTGAQPGTASSAGSKRSASPAAAVPKKRAVGERVSSKDFIPPDVSGLSKREARLVKNRAAAFLSRQRKREEFENMEIRVAELEQENARLLALAQSGGSSVPAPQPTELVSEVEQLKAQLAAAQERERSLSAQLASTAAGRDVPVKLETSDSFSLSSPSRSNVSSAHKAGASLGLMVLLCALPSLLSMRVESPAAPTSFSIPNPFPTSSASAYDYNSFVPNDYDWSKATGSSLMDLDSDNSNRVRKLEFSGADSPELGGLGDLDISFDASPSEDGKIRVRIHSPSSSSSSRSGSPGSPTYSSGMSSSSSLAMWAGSDSEANLRASFPSQYSSLAAYAAAASHDPFLGASANDFGMPFASDGSVKYENVMSSPLNYGQLSESAFGFGSEYTIPDSTTGGKRRVRIALKSMPQAGGAEGGEWEVQLC